MEAKLASSTEDGEDKPAKNCLVTIGEGGDSGDIIPGKSLVFASLEVCLCVLVRHLPALNPAIPGAHHTQSRNRLTDDACQLISNVLQLMTQLPPLCSHAGQ